MAILQLTAIKIGQSGVQPGSFKMLSNDSLAEITSAGYLHQGTSGQTFMRNDIIETIYNYGSSTATNVELYVSIDSLGVITLMGGANSFDTLQSVYNDSSTGQITTVTGKPFLISGPASGRGFSALTQSQRDAISSGIVSPGLVVYNTDTNQIDFWNGSSWVALGGSSATISVTDDNSTNATMYPVWVSANSGAQATFVSSLGFQWNPSTQTLKVGNDNFGDNISISQDFIRWGNGVNNPNWDVGELSGPGFGPPNWSIYDYNNSLFLLVADTNGDLGPNATTLYLMYPYNSFPNSTTASQLMATDSNNLITSIAYGSSNSASTVVQRDGSGNFSSGTISISTAGATLKVAEGSNACKGTVTLSGASTTVTTSAVATDDMVILQHSVIGGTPGVLTYTISNGVSFTITSTAGVADTSDVKWLIIKAA